MPLIELNDINLYYEVRGDGEPLLMINGLGMDVDAVGPMIDILAKKYMVIAFDHRGMGRSDKSDEYLSIELMAEDTMGLIDALDIKYAHVLGSSMGSRVAQVLAERYPERVKSLILHVAAAKVPYRENLKVTIAMWLMLIMIKSGRLEKMIPTKYPPTRKSVLHQYKANIDFDGRNALVKIKAPTLIVNGTKDISNPIMCSEELANGIKDSKLILVEGDHIFVAKNPELLFNPVFEFLEEIDNNSNLKA